MFLHDSFAGLEVPSELLDKLYEKGDESFRLSVLTTEISFTREHRANDPESQLFGLFVLIKLVEAAESEHDAIILRNRSTTTTSFFTSNVVEIDEYGIGTPETSLGDCEMASSDICFLDRLCAFVG